MRDLKAYVGLTETSRESGYSTTFWRNLADTGRVRAVRAAGRRLLLRSDVERLKTELSRAQRKRA